MIARKTTAVPPASTLSDLHRLDSLVSQISAKIASKEALLTEIARCKDTSDTSAALIQSCKEAEEQYKNELASLQDRNAHMLGEREVSLPVTLII
jgi:hypothetical protein